MSIAYTYKPTLFFFITFAFTWISWFIAAYFSYQPEKDSLKLLFAFLGLFVPGIVALCMLYTSKNPMLIQDFWHRLTLFKINQGSLIMILVIIPAAFFIATAISLLFGKSTEQFALAAGPNVLQGSHLLSLIISIFLAPVLEEIGWRGYGVDSLRAYFNLLYTCLLFGILWSLWHLPLFFIKGYYHYELRSLNVVYVLNFFISIIPAAILLNWIYYKSFRSILVAIFAHAMLNALSTSFKTEPFTKCIFTILLSVVACIIIFTDKDFFLHNNSESTTIPMHNE